MVLAGVRDRPEKALAQRTFQQAIPGVAEVQQATEALAWSSRQHQSWDTAVLSEGKAEQLV
jgi:hypothetical protein